MIKSIFPSFLRRDHQAGRPRLTRPARSALLALLLTGLAGLAAGNTTDVGLADLFPNERQARTTVVINKALERFHYRPFKLDGDFAGSVLTSYLEDLDPGKLFFLARDVDRFSRGNRLDADLGRGKLDTPFDIFRIYRMRVDTRIAHALSILDQRFDFERPETYLFDRKQASWAATEAQLDETWRQRIKNDFLLLLWPRRTMTPSASNYATVTRVSPGASISSPPMMSFRPSSMPSPARWNHTPATCRRAPRRTSISACGCRWKGSAPCCEPTTSSL
jgi:hypothetical protein